MNININPLYDEVLMPHRGSLKTTNIGYMEALYGVGDENELLGADKNELLNNLIQNLKNQRRKADEVTTLG